MTIRVRWIPAAGLALACIAAGAQPGPRASDPVGPGCGPLAGASAPAAGCPGGASGARRGMGARWGQGYTPGWSLMTPAERQQHQEKLGTLKTYEECRAYLNQHHEQMAAQAREKGRALPAMPRRDACANLPTATTQGRPSAPPSTGKETTQ